MLSENLTRYKRCGIIEYMTLEETLVKFGLEDKEAKVYLASLELGPTNVAKIAKKAEIKRPTAYLVLDSLADRGFVAKTAKGKKLLYTAEKPEALLRSIRTKEEILEEAMPMLRAVMATSKERPKIAIFEGKQSLEQVYSEIYTSPAILWFGSIRDINIHFPEEPKKMARASKQRKIRVDDILTDSPEDIEYAKMVKSPNHKVRIMPKGMKAPIDFAIYGNKVAIFSIKKELFAVIIESQDVAESFKSFHKLAWQSARPLAEVFKKKKKK